MDSIISSRQNYTQTKEYETIIGLEVHAQLLTKTKQFCGCSTQFGSPPNTNVCPVCLGLPGSLPVLNEASVDMAVRAALALGCVIRSHSVFARKNYFYPDLPKGYQISQFDLPFSEHGVLEISTQVEGKTVTKTIGIKRIHLEEDAGKNLHGVASVPGKSVIDLNRAGVPLIEIVSEPDLSTAEEAIEYLKRLREILIALKVNDGNLEEGSFRCDVNISVRPVGSSQFGTRVEIKNLNSFRHVQKAIGYERERLTTLARANETFRQHTRQWDDTTQKTVFLRAKEESDDYRYFPEPDLPPLVLDDAYVSKQKISLPELPQQRRVRWMNELKLSGYDVDILTMHPQISEFFEEIVHVRSHDPVWAKRAANFVMTEVLADVVIDGLCAKFSFAPVQVIELLELVEANRISARQAKEIYLALKGNLTMMPKLFIQERGIARVDDAILLESLCQKAVQENPKQRAAYASGKTGLLGFFVGLVMKETKGSADPELVNSILLRILNNE